jgi:hypothetical protein
MPNTPRTRRGTLVGRRTRRRRRRTIVKSRSSDPLSGFEFSSPRNSRREANIYQGASKKKLKRRRRRRKTKRKQKGGGIFHKSSAQEILDDFSRKKHLSKTGHFKNILSRISKPFLRIGEIFSGSLAGIITVNIATIGGITTLCTPLAAISGLVGLTVAFESLIRHNDDRIKKIKSSAKLITMTINELFHEKPSALLLNLLRPVSTDDYALRESYYGLIEDKYYELKETFPEKTLDFERSMLYTRDEASLKLSMELLKNGVKIENELRRNGANQEADAFINSISSIKPQLQDQSLKDHLAHQYSTDQAFAVFHPDEMQALAQSPTQPLQASAPMQMVS